MNASDYLKTGIITGIVIFVLNSFFLSIIGYGFQISISITLIFQLAMYAIPSAIFSLFLFYFYDKIPGKNLKRKIIISFVVICSIFLIILFNLPRGGGGDMFPLLLILVPLNIIYLILYAHIFDIVLKKISKSNKK